MIPDNTGVNCKTYYEFEIFKKIVTSYGETRINRGKFNHTCNWWEDDNKVYGSDFVAAKHRNHWRYSNLKWYKTNTKVQILSFQDFYSKYYKRPDFKYLL